MDQHQWSCFKSWNDLFFSSGYPSCFPMGMTFTIGCYVKQEKSNTNPSLKTLERINMLGQASHSSFLHWICIEPKREQWSHKAHQQVSFFFFYLKERNFKARMCMHVDVYILKWNLTNLVSNKKTVWFI